MPDRAKLVVVVIADVGLRCQLAARLSLLDIELLTASRYRQLLPHPLGESAILVMEEADLAGPGNPTIEMLDRDGRWRRFVVVTNAVQPRVERDWPIYLTRSSADAILPRYIEEWTARESTLGA